MRTDTERLDWLQMRGPDAISEAEEEGEWAAYAKTAESFRRTIWESCDIRAAIDSAMDAEEDAK